MTTTPAEPTVAIVGSGPAGCYTAQFLRKAWRDAEIVIFDRLDVPHGLVRYGVAPDHPGTKAIAKQFDRLFERDGVRFLGSTLVGSDPATSVVDLDSHVHGVANVLVADVSTFTSCIRVNAQAMAMAHYVIGHDPSDWLETVFLSILRCSATFTRGHGFC